MVLDLIVIGLFILFIAAGIVKGAARMILGLVMSFAAFLAASWLGKLLAGVIYDAYCAPAVGRAAEKSISASSDVISELPGWADTALSLSGKMIGKGSVADASQLTDSVNGAVRPITVGMIAVVLILILFIMINLILHKLVMPLILPAFHLRFIGSIDRILGGVIGAAEGVLFICMLAFALKQILPHIHSDVSFLNETTIYNSFIFYHFYSGNIFTVLTSWIGLG